MIKSMTGFASLTREDERATIAVTIRAVNHRFLDLQLRMPAVARRRSKRELRALVAAARRARPRRARRRRCSCGSAPALEVEFNEEFARGARRRRSTRRASAAWSRRADARAICCACRRR